MRDHKTDLLNEVAEYYASKLTAHGETPRGVDWNGEASQHLRFEQLARVTTGHAAFSINDLGCGYGALYGYLAASGATFTYNGFDVVQNMVEAGQRRYAGATDARFVCGNVPDTVADFGVASGIFNVRLGRSDAEWKTYLEATLEVLNRTSSKGFAFNCLTSWSDADRMRSDLYYADPCELFSLCKRRFSRNVALLHDYGLYEFTILVKKS